MDTTEDLARSLEQIGLTDKEAKVYLALLSLESSTAYEIAQHCEVKKPTVYVILEDLRQKGLVLKVPHPKKALFAAKDLSEYLAEQRGKLNAVQSMIPRLLGLGSVNKPKVYFYNGLRGMADALDYRFDSMRGKTYHSFYGNLVESDPRVIALYDRWDNEAVDAGMSFDVIMPKSGLTLWQTGLKKLHDANAQQIRIKFLEEYSHPSNISIEIAEDFVRIDDAKFLTSTIIDDRATAEAMRQIFNIVWQKGQ
jgi:DNA-binding MarR family transcriptional regulator